MVNPSLGLVSSVLFTIFTMSYKKEHLVDFVITLYFTSVHFNAICFFVFLKVGWPLFSHVLIFL